MLSSNAPLPPPVKQESREPHSLGSDWDCAAELQAEEWEADDARSNAVYAVDETFEEGDDEDVDQADEAEGDDGADAIAAPKPKRRRRKQRKREK